MEYTALREKLVTLTRILFQESVLGVFGQPYGHISLRIPDKELVLVTPGLGTYKDEIRPEDLSLVDFQGNPVGGKGHLPKEIIMHTAIHRARNDAMGVAHIHPFYCTLLTVAGIKYVPLTMQQAAFNYDIPVLDKAELVVTPAEGEELVRVLGSANALFIRGHGVMVVGGSAEELLYLALCLEDGARFLAEALKLGKPIPLKNSEVEKYLLKGAAAQMFYSRVWASCEAKLGHS